MKQFYEITYRYFRAPWNTGARGELVSLVESGRLMPGRAIDLGFGTGANALYLAQKGFEVTGVDYATAAIEKARARAKETGTQVNFIVDDLTNLRHVSGAFVDFQYEYATFLNSTGALLLTTLLYTAFFGAWAWTLVHAVRGSRRALIAALILNVLILLVIPVGALVAYCPSPCGELWPVMEVANWLTLFFGLLATVALALQILRSRTVSQNKVANPYKAAS